MDFNRGWAAAPIKIVFLDFDGVIITPESSFRRIGPLEAAHPKAIEALNYLLSETGARLVISSTWREDYSVEELRKLLKGWGVAAEILGTTPLLDQRSEEIQSWLDECSLPIGAFVILDDMTDMGHLASRLINTDFETGLTMSHAVAARDLLIAPGDQRSDKEPSWPLLSPRDSTGTPIRSSMVR